MLPSLRDHRGKPTAGARLLAAAVVLGMVLLAAPALFPVLRWLSDLLL
jgi:hypothetical protein